MKDDEMITITLGEYEYLKREIARLSREIEILTNLLEDKDYGKNGRIIPIPHFADGGEKD